MLEFEELVYILPEQTTAVPVKLRSLVFPNFSYFQQLVPFADSFFQLVTDPGSGEGPLFDSMRTVVLPHLFSACLAEGKHESAVEPYRKHRMIEVFRWQHCRLDDTLDAV